MRYVHSRRSVVGAPRHAFGVPAAVRAPGQAARAGARRRRLTPPLLGPCAQVLMRLGRQRWKLKGRIESDDSQTWDEEEKAFIPTLHENFEIKVGGAWGRGQGAQAFSSDTTHDSPPSPPPGDRAKRPELAGRRHSDVRHHRLLHDAAARHRGGHHRAGHHQAAAGSAVEVSRGQQGSVSLRALRLLLPVSAKFPSGATPSARAGGASPAPPRGPTVP